MTFLQEANDELEAVLMNRSLEQGKAVLSQTNREGTSIEMELRNMDDNQVRKNVRKYPENKMPIQLKYHPFRNVVYWCCPISYSRFTFVCFVVILLYFVHFFFSLTFNLSFCTDIRKAIEAQKGIMKHIVSFLCTPAILCCPRKYFIYGINCLSTNIK